MAVTDADDEFREKLAHMRRHGLGVMRSGATASTRTVVKQHDHTGERVGTETEHWSGRVDATAERMDVTVSPTLLSALKLKEVLNG